MSEAANEPLRERMMEVLSGEAEPARREELEAALAADPRAAAEFETLKKNWTALGALEAAMPKLDSESELRAKVMGAVKSELRGAPAAPAGGRARRTAAAAPSAPSTRRFAWALEAAAVVAICGLLYATFAANSKPPLQPPSKAVTPDEAPPDAKGKKSAATPAPTAAAVRLELQEELADWEKEIRKKLKRKVSFEFIDTPLDDVLTFFNSLTKVNIILDPAVREAGRTHMNLRVTDMELDLALNWTLRLADLDYGVVQQSVLVCKKFGGDPASARLVQPEAALQAKALQRKVTFEFVDTPLLEAVAFVRSMGSFTMIVDPRLPGAEYEKTRINLRVTDMPLITAIEWIGRLGGVEVEFKNDSVLIAPAAGKGGWKRISKPLETLPATVKLDERLAVKAALHAGNLSRSELLRRISEDAGIEVDAAQLTPDLAKESIRLPSEVRTIAGWLAVATKGAHPPLIVERMGEKLIVRPFTVDERLDRTYAPQDVPDEEDMRTFLAWNEITSIFKSADLHWEWDKTHLEQGKKAATVKLDPTKVNPYGLTCRQALDLICRAVGWAWRVEGDTVIVAPAPLPPKDEKF